MAEHVKLNVGVVSHRRSDDVAATPVEEKNTLESREDLARGKATQATILTKPRRRKLHAMTAKASGEGNPIRSGICFGFCIWFCSWVFGTWKNKEVRLQLLKQN